MGYDALPISITAFMIAWGVSPKSPAGKEERE
jgi:hypothetical protein